MAKGSESIWTAARRRLKMPDVEGLTEPQYAELIFGKKCQVSRPEDRAFRASLELISFASQNCYGDKVGKIYYDFHIRRNLCKKCRRLKIIRIKNFATDEPVLHERLHPFALECAMKTPRKPGQPDSALRHSLTLLRSRPRNGSVGYLARSLGHEPQECEQLQD